MSLYLMGCEKAAGLASKQTSQPICFSLSQGEVAVIDRVDLEKVLQHHWYASTEYWCHEPGQLLRRQ